MDELVEIPPNDFKTFVHPASGNQTNKDDYFNCFKQLKAQISSGRFEKVILSRTKLIKTSKSALEIFHQLNDTYKNTFNYLISNAEIGTWIGATPERLLSVEGNQLKTMSLAGTKTPESDWTTKEFEEQKLVTDSIVQTLKNTNCTHITKNGPSTIQAGKIEHLQTQVTAQLNHPADWTKVVNALHPTPAVCGIPKKEALSFIPELEKHDRKFYTGFLGICSPEKKDFYVNLRCMELQNGQAKLYLGGGITAPSVVEAEWKETERKSETLTRVLA